MKKKRYGKNGEDLIIKVPVGTVVIDEESGLVMKDLKKHGESFVAAKGGKGGKGNTKYATSTRQAPNFAEAGGFAKERNVILEMKLIADVRCFLFPQVLSRRSQITTLQRSILIWESLKFMIPALLWRILRESLRVLQRGLAWDTDS